MNKTIAALTLSAALAASGAAFAQQADGGKAGPADAPKHHRVSAEDRAALLDARIAALKAGLKLNADQEKLWPGVETALRDQAKQRAERMAKMKEARKDAREEKKKPDLVERLRMGAEMSATRAEDMRKLADAVEPLYKTLDDGQKRRLGALLKMGGMEMHHGPHKGGHRR